MTIGFIGLGSMGAPIARRLARAGIDVIGCDISSECLDAFDEPNTQRCADPIDTASQVGVLGICVRTDEQLESLLSGNHIYQALGEDGLIILNSTVAPSLARRLATDAARFGIGFIDVGVSGGAQHALDGKLSLFVGGEQATVNRAKPFLDAIGTTAYLGPIGRGLEGKLLNNILSIANMGLSALAIELGQQLDFDRVQLRDALLLGSAQSFAMDVIPGILNWKGDHGTAYFESLYALLEKDVVHGGDLMPRDDTKMQVLVTAATAMLDCVHRAGAQR